jgi:hypothetical protein
MTDTLLRSYGTTYRMHPMLYAKNKTKYKTSKNGRRPVRETNPVLKEKASNTVAITLQNTKRYSFPGAKNVGVIKNISKIRCHAIRKPMVRFLVSFT